MSIQKQSYTSKKTGKTRVRYFANIWYAAEKRSITGPLRDKEKDAKKDEVDLMRSIESGQAKARKRQRMITLQQVFDIWHEATVPPPMLIVPGECMNAFTMIISKRCSGTNRLLILRLSISSDM